MHASHVFFLDAAVYFLTWRVVVLRADIDIVYAVSLFRCKSNFCSECCLPRCLNFNGPIEFWPI